MEAEINITGLITAENVTMDVNRNRYGIRTFSIPFVITKEKAVELQCQLGYNPQGYGFHNFKVENGTTTWASFNSCD